MISENDNYTSNMTFKEYSISDFNEFEEYYGYEAIISTSSTDEITFTAVQSSITYRIYEKYVLDLQKYGNCYSLDLSVSIDYSYSGNRLGTFSISAGTFYEESDNTPTLDYEEYPYVCGALIKDESLSYTGVHGVFASPNGIIESYFSDIGHFDSTGTMILHISRDNDAVFCYVKEGYQTWISRTWNSGCGRPINFIVIEASIIPNSISDFEVSFNNFYATIQADTDTAIKSPLRFLWFLSIPAVVVLIYITNMTIVKLKNRPRRKGKFSIKNKELLSKYSWSLPSDDEN